MNLEDAELLIWKFLDREATSCEEDALAEACRQNTEIQELLERARLERRGLDHLASDRRETLFDAGALESAFSNLATRARSEAQTLRSLERQPENRPSNSQVIRNFWRSVLRPFPNLSGALVGAAAALGAVFIVSDPRSISLPPLDPEGVPAIGSTSPSPDPIGISPTRGGAAAADALTTAAEEIHTILSTASPDYARAVRIVESLRTNHPAALEGCTCESYRLQMIVAVMNETRGDFAEAARLLVMAGECLKRNPCAPGD